MNPLLMFWHFSLGVLMVTVSLIAAPAMLAVSATTALLSLVIRHRRHRRERRYSWSAGTKNRSAYRRARHGRWA